MAALGRLRGGLSENGWINAKEIEPDRWGAYRRFETGWMRIGKDACTGSTFSAAFDDAGNPVNNFGCPTPTGLVEFWPLVFETYCVDKANEFNPGKFDLVHEMMPHYDEPKSGPKGDVDMNEYPIILTTGRRIPVYFHSEHRQLPWCRELWPAPRLEVNPEDAAELGLEQGDWAWIETEWGQGAPVRRFVLRHREGVGERRARLVVPRAARADARVRAVEHRVHLEPLRPGSVHRVVHMRGVPVKIYKRPTPENCPDGKVIPLRARGRHRDHLRCLRPAPEGMAAELHHPRGGVKP